MKSRTGPGRAGETVQPSTRYHELLQQVDAAVRASDLARAGALAEEALKAGPEHPGLLNLVAQRRAMGGDVKGALDLLDRARRLAPSDVHVLNARGICLKDLGRTQEALASFDDAIKAAPAFAPAHYNKGTILDELNEVAQARAHYEAAVRLQPDYADALARLAQMLASQGQFAKGKEFGGRALALDPASVPAALALALCALSEGDLAEAKARAGLALSRAHSMPQSRALALGILGDVQDREGNAQQAFAHYEAANAALRETIPAAGAEGSALHRVELLIRHFESCEPWPELSPAGAPPVTEHVFLVGFPRSGTTLLEQVLAGNSRVVALEEKDILGPLAEPLLSTPQSIGSLTDLPVKTLDAYRADYWAQCRRHASLREDQVFIDKMPLNSIILCLIARLFPRAKILFAVRDPRDVVFSCFRQRFGLNAAMAEFLTLEGAARFYDRVMRLSLLYREKLALNVHEVRYEDLVADFDSTVSRVCRFLSIAFEPSMRDVAARVRERTVNTPSAAQIARGLYSGAGQWRRYEKSLAPVLPTLAPWALHFGYPAA